MTTAFLLKKNKYEYERQEKNVCKKSIGALITLLIVCLLAFCSAESNLLTIPASVLRIDEEAFFGDTSLDEVVLPEGIESIGNRAFAGSSIKRVYLPASLTEIAEDAFPLGTVGYGAEGTVAAKFFEEQDGLIFEVNRIELPAEFFTFQMIDDETCAITGYTGPSDVDLILPSHNTEGQRVVSIGDYAFYFRRSNLNGRLMIPDGVTSIGRYAFSECIGLTGDLIIPNSVTNIEDYAFYGCSGFKGNLSMPDNLIRIGAAAFGGCGGFTGELLIPDNVIEIGKGAFGACSGFSGDLVIPNNVISIGDQAFYCCYGFTGNLVIGNSVESIGYMAFYMCSYLTGDLVIPDSVTSIGQQAFKECHGFQGKLVIGKNVTDISGYAFSGCDGLTGSLEIPASVESIEGYVVAGCKDFPDKVLIHSSPTDIDVDYYAFPNSIPIIYNSTSMLDSFIQPLAASETIPDTPGSSLTLRPAWLSEDGETLLILNWWTKPKSTGVITGIGCTINFDLIVSGVHYYNITAQNNDNLFLFADFDDSLNGVRGSVFGTTYGCVLLLNSSSYNLNEQVGIYNTDGFIWRRMSNDSHQTIVPIIDYVGDSAIPIIPLTLGDVETSVISGHAFEGKSITGITIHESITSLGDKAFANCTSLVDVKIKNREIVFGNNVFFGSPNVRIRSYPGSSSQEYANTSNIVFKSLEFPDDLFLAQQANNTCTLVSSAMMIRAYKYLQGVAYDSVTEQNMVSNGSIWRGNNGLSLNYDYENVHVLYYGSITGGATNRVSLTQAKELLDANPEGFALFCQRCENPDEDHCVWICGYEGDILYCGDPAYGYSGRRIPLSESSLGNDQSAILSHSYGYWYIAK